MFGYKGLTSVEVSTVNGHADQLEDFIWNDGADTVADLGWLTQNDGVINARQALLQGRRHWYSIMVELHNFMAAVSWYAVNHD